ncbi:hypothetical protein ABZV61_05055 [Streptomyces sp900116325]|uniref:ABC transporter permease n=1 Tax=Streptomyces sp. 900116325 TaxID=3154295 RepID=A0ABV2U2U9_9ACTN
MSTRNMMEIVFLGLGWETDVIRGPLHPLVIMMALLATAALASLLHLFRHNAVVLR